MNKYDWFLIGYTFKTTVGHGTGSLIKGFTLNNGDKNITNENLEELTKMAKESCSVKETFTDFYVMSISYLGHMTQEEFYAKGASHE